MKINELIKNLEVVKTKYGNLDVEMYDRIVDCNHYANSRGDFEIGIEDKCSKNGENVIGKKVTFYIEGPDGL